MAQAQAVARAKRDEPRSPGPSKQPGRQGTAPPDDTRAGALEESGAVAQPANPQVLSPEMLLALQGTAGNAAVAELVGGKKAESAQQVLPRSAATGAGSLLVEAIGAGHEQGQITLQNAVEAGIATISSSVERGEQELDGAAATQTEVVRDSIAQARAKVRALIAAEQGHLRQVKATETARLAAWQRQAELTVSDRYDQQDHLISAMALSYSQRSRRASETAAANVRDQVEGVAERSGAIGNQKAAAATGKTPEIKQAQAKAAREIARNTSDKIREGLTGLTGSLRTAGAQTGQAFVSQGEQVVSRLRGGLTPVLGQLDETQRGTTLKLAEAVATGTRALTGAEKAIGASLTSLERKLVSEIKTATAAKKAELRAAGQQAQAQVQSQADAAGAGAGEALARLASLAGGVKLPPEVAGSLAGTLSGQLAGAFTQVAGDASSTTGELAAAVTEASARGVAALREAGGHAQEQVHKLVDDANPKLVREGRQLAAQVSLAASAGISAGDQLVAEAGMQLAGYLNQIEAGFVTGIDQFQGQLDSEVGAAVSKAQAPLNDLGSRIDGALHKIESDMSKSWLERQWDDLKEMASSPAFWAALGAALLVAVILVATLGTGVIALAVIGLAAGAAAGFAGTLTHNLTTKGRSWSDDLLKNTLIGGAVGLVAGLATAGLAVGGAAVLTPYIGLAAAKVVALVAAVQVVTFVMTVANNLLSGKPWDKGLLANLALAAITERLMSRMGPVEGEVKVGADGSVDPTAMAEVDPAVRETIDVDEIVHEFPEETVMQAPGAEARDPAVARLMYDNLIAQSPTREAGIYRNTATGEYIVVQGSEGQVSVEQVVVGPGGKTEARGPAGEGWPQAWKDILDVHSDKGSWELQAHSHPIEAGGVTSPANRLPSGAEGDFGVLMHEAGNSGGARSSRIDVTTEQGPDHTDFGYDPQAEGPLWAEYPEADGTRTRVAFKSIRDYHDWFLKKYHVDLGKIPAEAADRPPAETVPAAPRVDINNSVRLNPAEKLTAGRLQALLGNDLSGLGESPHEGADFVGEYKGKETSFDALGDGSKAQYFDLKQFIASIKHHLNKANDYTVIDMTGYSADQIKGVRDFLDGSGLDQSKIIRIGF